MENKEQDYIQEFFRGGEPLRVVNIGRAKHASLGGSGIPPLPAILLHGGNFSKFGWEEF